MVGKTTHARREKDELLSQQREKEECGGGEGGDCEYERFTAGAA